MPCFQSPNVGPPQVLACFAPGRDSTSVAGSRSFATSGVSSVLLVWVRVLWIPLSWNSTSLLVDRFWCPGRHPFCGVLPFLVLALLVGVFEFALSKLAWSVPLLMEGCSSWRL